MIPAVVIGSQAPESPDAPAAWNTYVWVEDADATAAKVRAVSSLYTGITTLSVRSLKAGHMIGSRHVVQEKLVTPKLTQTRKPLI